MFAEKHNPAYEPTWCDVNYGFCNWKKGTQRIKEHETSEIHIRAACTMAMTQERILAGRCVNQEQLSARRKTVEKNLLILKRIMDIIIFLAQQNLAFCGHREYSCMGQSSVNEGNFLELCKLVAKYDAVLASHLSESNKDKFYLSPDIQNDLIKCIANQVRDAILQKIKQSKYYSLIVDESRDFSRAEQLSISLRFVNEQCEIEEAFLCFESVPCTSAEYLYEVIVKNLKDWDLPLELCRGQCYDGCANMAGERSGVQERIASQNKLAIFVHCCAHNLNLALVDSCKASTQAVTFFGTLEKNLLLHPKYCTT